MILAVETFFLFYLSNCFISKSLGLTLLKRPVILFELSYITPVSMLVGADLLAMLVQLTPSIRLGGALRWGLALYIAVFGPE